MRSTFRLILPAIIGTILSIILGITVWKPFYFVFTYIGVVITFGMIMERKTKKLDLGRRIAILLIAPLFLIFFGVIQRENMQLEETVFYGAYFLTSGVFTRVLIHYAIAKVFGPLLIARGFCGWACWTAAILEWLPIKENRKIPKKYTYYRIPMLIISLLIPYLFIQAGYDYMSTHIISDSTSLIQNRKFDQLIWFLAGNLIYYVAAIILAFVFQKKRAFCLVMCPVSLVMKVPTKLSMSKFRPSGKKCIECGKCNSACPMDVDVMSYIKNGKKIGSTECIGCALCMKSCPVKAIR